MGRPIRNESGAMINGDGMRASAYPCRRSVARSGDVGREGSTRTGDGGSTGGRLSEFKQGQGFGFLVTFDRQKPDPFLLPVHHGFIHLAGDGRVVEGQFHALAAFG